MRSFLTVVIWAAALFVGLFIWNVVPDFRPLIAWVLAAAFLCYVLSTIVEVIVKRLVCRELQELRSRLDVIDRKVTAILRDALEQRRLRGSTLISGDTSP
jgi:Flp pilus assembly protein TadB